MTHTCIWLCKSSVAQAWWCFELNANMLTMTMLICQGSPCSLLNYACKHFLISAEHKAQLMMGRSLVVLVFKLWRNKNMNSEPKYQAAASKDPVLVGEPLTEKMVVTWFMLSFSLSFKLGAKWEMFKACKTGRKLACPPSCVFITANQSFRVIWGRSEFMIVAIHITDQVRC